MISVFLARLKRKVSSVLSAPKRYANGKKALQYLRSLKTETNTVIVLTTLIGDSIYGLSVLDAYKEKTGKQITVVGNEKLAYVLQSYASIDRLILLPAKDEKYKLIKDFLRSPKLSNSALHEGIINANPYLYMEEKKPLYYLLGTVFGLNEEYPITYHALKEQEVVSIPEFEQRKNQIVILNPYSNSVKYVTDSIWNDIADVLTAHNYKVYTNVIGEQVAVKGTEPLRCSLEELYSIACGARMIVSTRSGILDLLIPSGVDILAIYENTRDKFNKMYALSAWKAKGRIHEEIVRKGTDITRIVSELNKFIGTEE